MGGALILVAVTGSPPLLDLGNRYAWIVLLTTRWLSVPSGCGMTIANWCWIRVVWLHTGNTCGGRCLDFAAAVTLYPGASAGRSDDDSCCSRLAHEDLVLDLGPFFVLLTCLVIVGFVQRGQPDRRSGMRTGDPADRCWCPAHWARVRLCLRSVRRIAGYLLSDSASAGVGELAVQQRGAPRVGAGLGFLTVQRLPLRRCSPWR